MSTVERECGRMLAAQQVYGPDGSTVRLAGTGAALGMSLAHCLPEDRFDTQPISLAEGRFTLAADCRIDNRIELTTLLGLRDRQHRMSDGAIVAAAFERWGEACFDRLRGDFAVAIWDARERHWILARDPTGNTPLFFHCSANMTAIASMPQGLNALHALPGKPDAAFVAYTLRTFSMRGAGSYWQRIQRVMPGHIAILRFDGSSQYPYWTVPSTILRLRDRREYAAALREKIELAVSRRVRGETRVATHLSAGLDSGTITGAVATHLLGSGKVVAFTSAPRLGYDPGPVTFLADEEALAAATARMHANVEHVVVRARDTVLSEAIDRQFHLAQQPAANVCNLGWIHSIASAAQERSLTVLMPAQFGNFALSYDGAHMLSDPIARGDWGRAGLAFLSAGRDRLGLLRRSLGTFAPSLTQGLRGERHVRFSPGRSIADTQLTPDAPVPVYAEAQRDAIGRVDNGPNRKAMFAGWRIDERDPSSDRDLLDFAATVPLTVFRDRALIRRAAKGWMADEALRERRRGYQAADWHETLGMQRPWLATEMAAIADEETIAELIDIERLGGLLENWPEGGWHRRDIQEKYRSALLRGISIGHFMRRARGSNR